MIKETDEKPSKTMEEMLEKNAKALKELKIMISGMVTQCSEMVAPCQPQVSNGAGILDPGMGYSGKSHYTNWSFQDLMD